MHVGTPFVNAAAPKRDIGAWHYYRAAVPATHVTDASGQRRQRCNPQPNFNSVKRTFRIVHSDLSLAEEIKKCGGSRNTTRRVLNAHRSIFSAWPGPQTWQAAVIKSPNVISFFCLAFIRDKIT